MLQASFLGKAIYLTGLDLNEFILLYGNEHFLKVLKNTLIELHIGMKLTYWSALRKHIKHLFL